MTGRTAAGRTAAGTVRVEATAIRRLLLGLAALAALATMAGASHASDLRMTVQKPHFTCEGHARNFSDVAFHPGGDNEATVAGNGAADAAPLPCCDGQIGCAQFLSTNTVVRTPHEWHG